MLQCPRCSNPLTLATVSHCHKTQAAHTADSDDRLKEGDIIHYPMYHNTAASPVSPRVSPTAQHYHQQQELARVRDVRTDLENEKRNLELRMMQNNIEQLLIQQDMILQHQAQQSQLPRFTSHVSDTRPTTLVDIEAVLRRSKMELEQSGWYYGHLSWQQSSELLHATSEGTFLVRDSQDPRFLYSLSLQRAKDGPTSVRISFSRGKFSLDADDRIKSMMPEFDSVGALVCHYATAPEPEPGDARQQKTINSRLCIKKPLYKQPPSLAHSARLSINRNFKNSQKFSTQNSEQVQIPRKLLDYLEKYSFCI